MMSIDGKLEIEESETVQLRYLISYCLDIDLGSDINAAVCQECIERLKFIYSFKTFCKKNNDNYFICYPSTSMQSQQELAVEPHTVQYDVKREPVEESPVIQEEFEDLLVETQLKTEDDSDIRRLDEMKKNADRQRQKRASETAEERAIRTQKATEQTKRRRYYLKEHCPEEYAKRLARVAEQRRIKRHNMSPEDRAIERAREAAAVRLRRQNMTPEQKEKIRQRNREAARLRRGSSLSLSLSHSDCSNPGPIESIFIES
jgi:hypothetical protein